MTRVKICCITSREDAALAVRYGADALGLVSWMPTGVGVISDGEIRALAQAIPRGVRRFLLTCKRDPAAIAQQAQDAGTDAVQLVDRMARDDLRALRRALPEITLVQVIHVTGQAAVREATRVAPDVDYLLLDSGRPDAADRELGGTGRTHDWSISAEIVREVETPVFLAGGLGPDNVGDAIQQVRPFGVDVCSRLRPARRLDETLLARFVRAVEAADAV